MGEYTVCDYTDLHGSSLTDRAKGYVLQHLEKHETILWLEEWLREDKALDELPETNGLYAVTVERETDKAWYAAQESGAEWVPKSCAELFIAVGEVDTETPQSGLTEFGP